MLIKINYYKDEKGNELAEFNKMVFVKEETGYYRIKSNWNKNIKNSYRLHQAVYEYYNDDIPKGFNVHHIDEDKDNNEIENLKLVSTKEHNVLHFPEDKREKSIINFKKANIAAVIWHKTNPKSHKIHSEASIKGWENRVKYEHICIRCGNHFRTKEKECKFCSGKCKNDYKLGYSLLKIEKIEYIGRHDVYNMEVEKYHNYAIDGGTIIHNCDAIRYYINTILKIRILRGLK